MKLLYHPRRALLGFEPYVAPENFDRKAQPVDIYDVFCRYYLSHRTAKWIYSVSNATATTKPHGGTSYRYGYELAGVSYQADLAEGYTITWDGSATKRWVIALHTTMSMMRCTCVGSLSYTPNTINQGADWLYCGNMINSVITSTTTAMTSTVKWIHIHRLLNIDTYDYCAHYYNTSLSGNLYLSSSATILGGSFQYGMVFNGCSGLYGDLVIPSSFTIIGGGSFARNFGGFSSVTFEEGLVEIGPETFWNTILGGTLTFPKSLQKIGYEAFLNSTGLSGPLAIPEYCAEIGYGAFGFTNFDEIVTYNTNFIVDDYCLYDITGGRCWALHGQKDYSGTLTLRTGTSKIQAYCFASNTGRTGNVVILNTVTEIQYYGFASWTSTGTFTFEATSVCTKIGFRGLSGCKWTGSMSLPDSMQTFDYGALESCTGFTSLTFGSGMVTIGERSCAGLTGVTGNIVIPDSVTIIAELAFYGTENPGLGTLTIGSGVTSIARGIIWLTKFNDIICNASGYVVSDYVLYDEKTSGQVKAIGGCLARVEPLIIKSSCTEILVYSFSSGNYTRFNLYPTTAPVVGVNTFGNFNKELHIQSGATGYDVLPWTNTAIFSSITADL